LAGELRQNGQGLPRGPDHGRYGGRQVLQPELAAKIMFKGMEEGMFTGKKFADYFSPDDEDWKNARRIINGNDCDEAIAVYAKKFYAAISHTTH
jgi:hypothetical protein